MSNIKTPVARNSSRVGQYLVIEELGSGAFGTVYLAQQPSTGQKVAIKVLRNLSSDSEFHRQRQLSRFEREVQICSELHHPNIVRILDSGRSEGHPLLVLEYVPGQTLREYLDERGAMSPEEVREVMAQVLDALACAHRKGVVHRDIKPANIVISQTGARLQAKVLDFGIGTLVPRARDKDFESLTLTREVLGTPSYCAPEQLRGEAPTEASDIYAWGLLFIECLSGAPAVLGASVAELVAKQLSPLEVPLAPALAGHRLGLLLRRALRKRARDRSSDASELLSELESLRLTDLVGQLGCSPQASATAGGETGATRQLRPGTRGQLVYGERRQLTVACCRVTASPLAGGDADAELVDTFQADLLVETRDLLSRYGAYHAGTLGDHVMLYFGYPEPTDSDCRRAASAALELAAQIRRRDAAMRAERGITLELSIGIHTGVVALAGDGLPQGRTPSLALRLMTAAAPGEILVSEQARRVLTHHMEFGERRLLPAAPGTTDLPAHCLSGETLTEALGFAPAGALDKALVGRGDELSALVSSWKAAQGRAGAMLLLSGQAGIGKSRLVSALRRHVREGGFRCWEARCRPEERNNALYPIVELLRRRLDLKDHVEAHEATATLARYIASAGLTLDDEFAICCGWFGLTLPDGSAPSSATPGEQRTRSLELFARLLAHLNGDGPLLLVLEDLHWADPSTLELIEQMRASIVDRPILVVCTARPECVTPWSTDVVPRLDLCGLEEPSVRELIASIPGAESLPSRFVEAIAARTDGIPLFVEEMTRAILGDATEGKRQGLGSRWSIPDDTTVPLTLRDSLASRLAQLGRAKESAQIAAAIGREFDESLLVEVSLRDEAQLRADLDALLAADLVVARRTLREQGYAFRHALIRDAAYESMPRESRVQVHKRIAGVLKSRSPGIEQDRPAELGRHLAGAESYAAGVECGLRAAQSAMARSLHHESLGHARTALAWAEHIHEPADRARWQLELHGLLVPVLMGIEGFGSNEAAESGARCQALIAEIERHAGAQRKREYESLLHRSEWALFNNYHSLSQREDARKLGDSLERRARRSGDRQRLLGVLPMIAQAVHVDGDLVLARQKLEEAIGLYEHAKDSELALEFGYDPFAFSNCLSSNVLTPLGHFDLALQRVQTALSWAEKVGHTVSADVACLFTALVHFARGDRDGVVQIAQYHREHHGKDADSRWVPAHLHAVEQWATDQIGGFLPYVAEQKRSGQDYCLSWYEVMLADVYTRSGEAQSAIAVAEESLERCLGRNERWTAPILYHALAMARVAAAGGLSAQAEHEFNLALESARELGARGFELAATSDYARCLSDAGHAEQGRSLVEPLLTTMTEAQTTAAYRQANALAAGM